MSNISVKTEEIKSTQELNKMINSAKEAPITKANLIEWVLKQDIEGIKTSDLKNNTEIPNECKGKLSTEITVNHQFGKTIFILPIVKFDLKNSSTLFQNYQANLEKEGEIVGYFDKLIGNSDLHMAFHYGHNKATIGKIIDYNIPNGKFMNSQGLYGKTNRYTVLGLGNSMFSLNGLTRNVNNTMEFGALGSLLLKSISNIDILLMGSYNHNAQEINLTNGYGIDNAHYIEITVFKEKDKINGELNLIFEALQIIKFVGVSESYKSIQDMINALIVLNVNKNFKDKEILKYTINLLLFICKNFMVKISYDCSGDSPKLVISIKLSLKDDLMKSITPVFTPKTIPLEQKISMEKSA